MPRIRSYKPEIWSDGKTGTLSDTATKTLLGLWTFSDDMGVIPYDKSELRAKIYPYDRRPTDRIITNPIEKELVPKILVVLFTWENRVFLWTRNFLKHQRIDKPGPPNIQNFKIKNIVELLAIRGGLDEYSPNVPLPLQEYSTNALGGLQEDSRRKGKEGKGKEGSGVEGMECEEGRDNGNGISSAFQNGNNNGHGASTGTAPRVNFKHPPPAVGAKATKRKVEEEARKLAEWERKRKEESKPK